MLEAPALTGATSPSWCALRGATALPAHDVAFARSRYRAQRDLHVKGYGYLFLATGHARGECHEVGRSGAHLLDGVGWLQPLAAWRLGEERG